MKLWTFQLPGTAETVKTTGTYRCDAEQDTTCASIEAYDAYDFMVESMEKKGIKKPDGVKYPVWAWYRIDGKNARPNCRSNEYRQYQATELLELEVPDEQVLLSDFDGWHDVLNRCYHDGSKTEQEYDEAWSWYESLQAEEQERVKRESWNGIFDIDPIIETEWCHRGLYVQAVFWEIKPEYIKKVTRLKGYPEPSYLKCAADM